jgi:MFS family permease
MTEPTGERSRQRSGAWRRGPSVALWAAFAGHLLVLMAAVTDAVPPKTTIVAAIACSFIAVAALTELAPPDVQGRRAVTALTAGHGIAAATLLAGLAPSVPWSMPLAGLAAAVALGVACLVTVGRASTMHRPPRPLTMAPRVAAIALVVQVVLQRWLASATGLSMPLRVASLLAIVALGVAQLASLSIIAVRVRPRWAIAGLLAWTVGWVAITADLSALILWSFGGPFPTRSGQLDATLVQILATVGGVAIGAALVTSIRDVRFRHSAVVLLAGYAAFGVMAAVAEHRIELATDFPGITALRRDRDLSDAITAATLAGVLWLYWRRVAASDLPGATPQEPRA